MDPFKGTLINPINLKKITLNPKPITRNPKPKTLNHKSLILVPGSARLFAVASRPRRGETPRPPLEKKRL